MKTQDEVSEGGLGMILGQNNWRERKGEINKLMEDRRTGKEARKRSKKGQTSEKA